MKWIFIYFVLISTLSQTLSHCIDEASGKDLCFHPFNNNKRKVFYKFGHINDLYTTNYTITNLEVPFDGFTVNTTGDNWLNHPPVFFNLIDKNNATDQCEGQYVLIDKVAHKIFDGNDATLDRSVKNSPIYFAGNDGIYIYEEQTKTATKYGTINDKILEIEKVVGEDKFYILTDEHKIFAVTENATVKKEITGIEYARDFIIDLLGAIYFYGKGNKPQVLKQNEVVPYNFDDYFDFDIKTPLFVRPSLNYGFNGIVFIANGKQYFLLNCTTVEVVPKTGTIEEITGYNADGFVYQFIATGTDLYEHYLLGSRNGTDVQEMRPPIFGKRQKQ